MASCLSGGVCIYTTEQTINQRVKIMEQLRREDCVTVDDAAIALKYSKASVYAFMNLLGVERRRFPRSRRTWIAKNDVERIRKYIDETGGKQR